MVVVVVVVVVVKKEQVHCGSIEKTSLFCVENSKRVKIIFTNVSR